MAAAKERHYQQYAAIAAKNLQQPNEVLVPLDTLSVQRAKVKHLNLYDIIAAEHAQIAAERKADRLAKGIVDDDEQEGKVLINH